MNNKLSHINIDKDSPVPIYYQVASNIRERIINDEWAIGEKIPSELKLTEEYEISRVTLRKALDTLLAEDLIRKEQGKGVFVKTKPKPLLHDFSLPSVLGKRFEEENINISPFVISQHVSKPIPYINKILQLHEDEPLAYIKRVFLVNNKPFGLNRSWIADSKVPGMTTKPLINNRLSLTLSNVYNLKVSSIENTIQSVIPDPYDMRTLNINYLTPATQVKTTSFLEDSTPLEYSSTIWLGDRVQFTLKVTDDHFLGRGFE